MLFNCHARAPQMPILEFRYCIPPLRYNNQWDWRQQDSAGYPLSSSMPSFLLCSNPWPHVVQARAPQRDLSTSAGLTWPVFIPLVDSFFLFFGIMRALILGWILAVTENISHVLEGIYLYVTKRAPGLQNRHGLGGNSSRQWISSGST